MVGYALRSKRSSHMKAARGRVGYVAATSLSSTEGVPGRPPTHARTLTPSPAGNKGFCPPGRGACEAVCHRARRSHTRPRRSGWENGSLSGRKRCRLWGGHAGWQVSNGKGLQFRSCNTEIARRLCASVPSSNSQACEFNLQPWESKSQSCEIAPCRPAGSPFAVNRFTVYLILAFSVCTTPTPAAQWLEPVRSVPGAGHPRQASATAGCLDGGFIVRGQARSCPMVKERIDVDG